MRLILMVSMGLLALRSGGDREVPSAPSESLLLVHVTGLENDEGSVRVALFDGPEGFTDEPLLAVVASPADGEARWAQTVAPGVYAVAVFHDADDDGQLDTNFLGMPRERYGFSNDARGTFGPPSFEDASFVVSSDTVPVAVRVH